MATENGSNGDTNLREASTSKNQEQLNGENKDPETNKKKEKTNTISFYKLFAFADRTDIMLMIIGTIGAIGNGLCMPLMTTILGDLIDSFGQNQNNDRVVHVVSRVALRFVYLAAGAGTAACLRKQSLLYMSQLCLNLSIE